MCQPIIYQRAWNSDSRFAHVLLSALLARCSRIADTLLTHYSRIAIRIAHALLAVACSHGCQGSSEALEVVLESIDRHSRGAESYPIRRASSSRRPGHSGEGHTDGHEKGEHRRPAGSQRVERESKRQSRRCSVFSNNCDTHVTRGSNSTYCSSTRTTATAEQANKQARSTYAVLIGTTYLVHCTCTLYHFRVPVDRK